MRCVGVALMALMMVFAMTVGSFAATDATRAFDVSFSGSMANMVLTGEQAVYDDEADTLTIPIKSLTMGYDSDDDGVVNMCTGSLTGIAITDGEGNVVASGTAVTGASEIVINGFENATAGSYTTNLTVTVYDDNGDEVVIPPMANLQVTMYLA